MVAESRAGHRSPHDPKYASGGTDAAHLSAQHEYGEEQSECLHDIVERCNGASQGGIALWGAESTQDWQTPKDGGHKSRVDDAHGDGRHLNTLHEV